MNELENIEGIGPKKKQELLKQFGSIENIQNVSVEDLARIKGITKELAIKIKEELQDM